MTRETTVRPDAVDPMEARVALLLTTLGLLLSAIGAALLANPAAYAVLTLPVLALATVVWRTRQ